MEAKSGTKIGKYTLSQVIGTGGWGEVWEGRCQDTEESVAIKILRPSGGHTTPGNKARIRFRREAEVMCSLQSPWLCHAYSVCEDADIDGTLAFVMERMRGCNLSEYVRKNGAPEHSRIKKWMYQLLSALDEVHNRGIVHRDIKPSNIMLQPTDDIKLFDFGICKDLTVDYDVTQTPVYTVHYASPEQKSANTDEAPDAISDFYSLGKTLWFLCTARTPPAGNLTIDQIGEITDEVLKKAVFAFTIPSPEKRREETEKFIESIKGYIPDELPTMVDESKEPTLADPDVHELENEPQTISDMQLDYKKVKSSVDEFVWHNKTVITICLVLMLLADAVILYLNFSDDNTLTPAVRTVESNVSVPSPPVYNSVSRPYNITAKKKPVTTQQRKQTAPENSKKPRVNKTPDIATPQPGAETDINATASNLVAACRRNPTAKNFEVADKYFGKHGSRISKKVEDEYDKLDSKRP